MTWLLVVAGILGLVPLLWLAARREEQTVRRDWLMLLSPAGEKLYAHRSEQCEDDLAVTDIVLGRAMELQRVGSFEDAVRILDTGYGLIAQIAPDMRRRLASMAVFSRMVSAVVPMPPLRPSVFQTRQLVGLAWLQSFFQALLVGTTERFRWRVAVLGRCYSVLVRSLLGAKAVAAANPRDEGAWRGVRAARSDVRALTLESLESFRALLMSLAARPRS